MIGLQKNDWRMFPGYLAEGDEREAVSRFLGVLGEAHGADRTWVIRYNDSFTHFWNTQEGVRPGIDPSIQSLQSVPVEAAQ